MADNNYLFMTPGSAKAQAAVEVADPLRKSAPCVLQVDGKPVAEQIWLLTVEGQGAVNLQVDVNFNNAIFITVFGDKLTPMTFRGLVVPSACEAQGISIVNFYNKYKASASDTISIFTITYTGGFVFKGFLTNMQMNPYSQGGADAFTFDMTLQGRVI